MSRPLTEQEKDAIQALGQRVLDLAAGSPAEVCLLALADALATAIGALKFMAGETREDALALAEEIGGRIERHVGGNWGALEILREGRLDA